MKLAWDYTAFAAAYVKRPPYARAALERLLAVAALAPGEAVCDVGAGDGRASLALLERGLRVTAIEPNPAMRRIGVARTRERAGVHWVASYGEATPLAGATFGLVSFGSSFNVVDRALALPEAARILRPGGWIACFFQYRCLEDPLQGRIESEIRRWLPRYRPGERREDQRGSIDRSRLFGAVRRFEERSVETVDREDWLDAWRAHATLARQAGSCLDLVLQRIREVVQAAAGPRLEVPYLTRVWMARRLP